MKKVLTAILIVCFAVPPVVNSQERNVDLDLVGEWTGYDLLKISEITGKKVKVSDYHPFHYVFSKDGTMHYPGLPDDKMSWMFNKENNKLFVTSYTGDTAHLVVYTIAILDADTFIAIFDILPGVSSAFEMSVMLWSRK